MVPGGSEPEVIVGATHFGGGGGGGGDALTRIVADAMLPLPPSRELTASVVLFCVPAAVAVTLTLNAHVAPGASVVPDSVTAPDPGVATMAPPPQLPVRPLGVATTRPPGSASLKPTPVNVVVLFGLVIVKLSEVDSPSIIVTAPKDLAIVGGEAAPGTTVMLAAAVLPGPPPCEPTWLVKLFFNPSVVPVTSTLIVHEPPAPREPPAKLIVSEPAAATTAPLQSPTSPFGAETARPGGNGSVKLMPLKVTSLGLEMVKLSEVDPLSGMVAAPKALTIDGGERPEPEVIRTLSMTAPALMPCPVMSLTNVMVALSPLATKVKNSVFQ